MGSISVCVMPSWEEEPVVKRRLVCYECSVNQYAADAVFMELIHQGSAPHGSTFMADVFCSESCRVFNTV